MRAKLLILFFGRECGQAKIPGFSCTIFRLLADYSNKTRLFFDFRKTKAKLNGPFFKITEREVVGSIGLNVGF